jgi:hypothetical protein
VQPVGNEQRREAAAQSEAAERIKRLRTVKALQHRATTAPGMVVMSTAIVIRAMQQAHLL